MKHKITLGSDPELCLWSVEQGKIVSAIPVLKNDKYSPAKLPGKINVYADNVLVESSFPPVKTTNQLLKSLQTVFKRTQDFLGDKFRLLPKASHVYDMSELKDDQAWMVGCNPSWCAYTLKANNPSDFTSGLRTGSFHIHVGYEKATTLAGRTDTIKLLDAIVGTASIVFTNDDSSAARRALYGQAGEHRPTPYGLEWRVLDNYALRSPELTELTLNLIDYTLSVVLSNREKSLLALVDESEVRKAIDKSDKELALEVLKKLKLPKEIYNSIFKKYKIRDFNKAWGI